MFVATLSLWPTMASANWQFTRWGMTPEEVQVAAGGTLTTPAADERCLQCSLVPLLAGSYSTGEFSFRVLYQFDGNRALQGTNLNLTDGTRCHALQDSLRAQYGVPTRELGGDNELHSKQWLDPANGNTLRFVDSENLGLSCFIAYSPLASAKGL